MLVGHIDVDEKDAYMMLVRLDQAISPVGLTAFLGTRVDPYLRRRASERFENEGDDVTGAWAPLAPSTEYFRETEGFPAAHPINKRTGELEQYIIGEDALVVPLGAGAALELPGRQAGGWLAEKYKTAQQGKSYPRTQPRPVLGINERDRMEIMTMLMYFVGDVVGDGRA